MTDGMTTAEIVIATGRIIASLVVMGACPFIVWQYNRKAGVLLGMVASGVTTGALFALIFQAAQ